ncbi:DUF6397 family protein [Streptomyces sp. SHP 1-2]|uniref:DUF6397 family protein n=1 Tax=Streptomyces sp. SHP 1-2 TaxID=2769489 RepID=UPI0022370B6F|nr:DUF6397 family protein [Streptomyces sp. SHP 1-2]MCW5251237.1 hypothetical protein [Streptomyces sp. SHP 1-2]
MAGGPGPAASPRDIPAPPDHGGGGPALTGTEAIRPRAGADGRAEPYDGATAVGTAEGAALMRVAKDRFTRLARLGLLVPVAFYVNRYRTVVWLYSATELRRFATDESHARVLKGRMSEGPRDQLARGLDLRPRNWRGRHLERLLREAGHPWGRAAALAAFLDPAEVTDVVSDPYEQAHLRRFLPAPPHQGAPGSASARMAREIMTAADPDEVERLRRDLRRAVDAARGRPPVPRSGRPALRKGSTPRRTLDGHRYSALDARAGLPPAAPRPSRGALHPVPDTPALNLAPAPGPAPAVGRDRGVRAVADAGTPVPPRPRARLRALLGRLRRSPA